MSTQVLSKDLPRVPSGEGQVGRLALDDRATPVMETFGPCRADYCSCQRFVYTNDAQFCDNCGHSRSLHIH